MLAKTVLAFLWVQEEDECGNVMKILIIAMGTQQKCSIPDTPFWKTIYISLETRPPEKLVE